jgi:hypothetical protein
MTIDFHFVIFAKIGGDRAKHQVKVLATEFSIALPNPENPRELTGKMFQKAGFITSNLKKFLKNLRC